MDDHITLQFDLTTLPTAQHKAGLAGLVLSIQEMNHPDRQRGDNALDPKADIPILSNLTASSVEISLSETSCQKLLDDCYRAEVCLVESESKRGKKKPVDEFEKTEICPETGKTTTKRIRVYEFVEPRNPFLSRHLFRSPKAKVKDLWLKLFQQAMYDVIRTRDRARIPFKQSSKGTPTNLGASVWKSISKSKTKNVYDSLSGSFLIGAQDKSAELISMKDHAKHLLLLNFWPLVSLIYVPYSIKLKPSEPKKSKFKEFGYSIAVPDICNLEMFCSRFTGVLEALRNDWKPQGYRPDNACVELASMAPLSLYLQQAWLVGEKTKTVQFSALLNAVEYIHVNKDGQNAKILGTGRIAPDPRLLRRYQQIRKRYRSPFFRSIRLGSLLDRTERSWWSSFGKSLNTLPHEFFMAAPDLPYFLRSFRQDVRTAFAEESFQVNSTKSKGNDMAEDTVSESTSAASGRKEKSIEQIVFNMVRSYLIRKTESKTKVKYLAVKTEFEKQKNAVGDDGGKQKNSPEKNKFEEARAKLASRLFLEVRSRHGSDFGSYFAEHFGAVQQYTIASSKDFQEVCDQLLKSPEDVRVITLLALSANS